jgi:exodeoxyribonuclease VII small subunit
VAEKRTPVSKLSFNDAVGEVESIVARLENEDIDIDELAGEVQRAIELVTACRARLERTSEEVRDMVARLQEVSPAAPPAEDASV